MPLPFLASSIPALSDWEVLGRLALAAALGGALGVEREWRDHDAGFRTHLLVCLGSAIFTIVSAYGFEAFLRSGASVVRADPTRIAAQIVTGIGFLGAGAIIRQGMNIRGLTTAANLWVVAAIGLASGAGYYSAALIGTGVALIALWPLRVAADYTIERWRRDETRLVLELHPAAVARVFEELDRRRLQISRFEIERQGETRRLHLQLAHTDPTLAVHLSELDGVRDVAWGE
jgi:putative Mg2+ transporter-C (MgtC) family protein